MFNIPEKLNTSLWESNTKRTYSNVPVLNMKEGYIWHTWNLLIDHDPDFFANKSFPNQSSAIAVIFYMIFKVKLLSTSCTIFFGSPH